MKKLIFMIFILFIFSCETYYDLEIDTSTEVNVNGLLIAGKPVVITVSLTKKLLDTINKLPFDLVKDAVVILESDMGEKDTLHLTSDYEIYTSTVLGVYDTAFYTDRIIPQPGHWYKLKVYVSGYDTVYAETYVPYPSQILSYSYNKSEDSLYWQVFVEINDSVGEDYYLFLPEYSLAESSDPATELYREFGILLSDRLFEGQSYTYVFKLLVDKTYDEQIVIFFKVNKDFFLYVKSYYDFLKPELYNPFREPVVVYGNIENGLGIFAAITPSDTLIIK